MFENHFEYMMEILAEELAEESGGWMGDSEGRDAVDEMIEW